MPRKAKYGDIPDACGVYLLTHRKTGDTYIGGSIKLRARIRAHFNNPCAQNARLACLPDRDFAVTILEFVLAAELAGAEWKWMKKLSPTLNRGRAPHRWYKRHKQP